MAHPTDPLVRFFACLQPIPADPDECWVWHGTQVNGYGKIYDNPKKRQILVHVFAYENLVGPLPERTNVYRICRNSLCCNPRHLTTTPLGKYKDHQTWLREKQNSTSPSSPE